jgi:hypothetical protein
MGLNSMFQPKFFDQPTNRIIKISKDSYHQWQHHYLFDAIRNIGYGKSFCEYFGITDYILEFSKKEQECHSYILKTYVQLTT